eukprot:4593743-Prymnesium_polylepis.1
MPRSITEPCHSDDEIERQEDEVSEAPAPAPAARNGEDQQFELLFVPGSKIRMAFGEATCVAWYGGTVIRQMPSEDWLVAFDDGELHEYPSHQLKAYIKKGGLAAAKDNERGLVANKTGHAEFFAVTWVTKGRAKEPTPMGVLLGDTGFKMGGKPINDDHVVRVDSAEQHSSRTSRSRSSSADTTFNDRGGWHTFRKGDRVECISGLKRGESSHAIVFGFNYQYAA